MFCIFYTFRIFLMFQRTKIQNNTKKLAARIVQISNRQRSVLLDAKTVINAKVGYR